MASVASPESLGSGNVWAREDNKYGGIPGTRMDYNTNALVGKTSLQATLSSTARSVRGPDSLLRGFPTIGRRPR